MSVSGVGIVECETDVGRGVWEWGGPVLQHMWRGPSRMFTLTCLKVGTQGERERGGRA